MDDDARWFDAHVLLSDPARFAMKPLATGFWDKEAGRLDRPLGLAQYRAAVDGAVAGFAAVQVGVDPAYGLLEARWLAALDAPELAAIVAWAPVADGARVRTYLEALVAVDPRVCGVRHVLELEPPGFALAPGFVEGVRSLAAFGLSFELGVKGHQLPDAIALAERCPETRFILGHAGKPDLSSWDGWARDVGRLARLPNVVCKLSGLAAEADHAAWRVSHVADCFARAADAFGPERIVFGGDWPIVELAGGWRRWADAVEAMTRHWRAEDVDKFRRENARRFYRCAG